MERFEYSALELLADLPALEAQQLLPSVLEEQATLEANTARAEHVLAEARETRVDDDALMEVIRAKRKTLSQELSGLTEGLRPELYALRADFSELEQCSRIRRFEDAISYLDREYDYLGSTKIPMDELSVFDAVGAHDLCLSLELNHAALVSHIRTLASLVDLEAECGKLGVVSSRTESLKAQAKTQNAKYEISRVNARDARRKFELDQQAIASRGIITKSRIGHAI